MKFETYVNSKQAQEIINIINTQAKPFLKEFSNPLKQGKFIYRGLTFSNFPGAKQYMIKKTRKNRKPRYIRQDVHEYLSKISKELFGWDIRTKGVFTASKFLAEGYGNLSVFIPLGKYKYVYSTGFMLAYEYYIDKEKNTEFTDQDKQELYDIFYKYYHTSKLQKKLLLGSSFEAIFQCKNHLLIKPNYFQSIISKI